MSNGAPAVESKDNYKEEKRQRAIFTLKKRVKAGDVSPEVAKIVLDRYLAEPEKTEDTYFVEKLTEAQAIIDRLNNDDSDNGDTQSDKVEEVEEK